MPKRLRSPSTRAKSRRGANRSPSTSRASTSRFFPEVERAGLDAFDRIGEETSETIERRPASLVVVRVTRPKFLRKDRQRGGPTNVAIAEPPELPIPTGLAGPGMLADTIVKRWQDHIPLNRQEGIYARDGIELARSTIGHWHFELAALVTPLVEAMRRDAFKQPYLCTDSTGVLVLQREKCRTGHFWVLVAPTRHVLFEYTARHDSDAVDDVLAGYKGYIVADAHAVYDHLYTSGDVTEVNCWAHCRRYFFKAMTSDPKRAATALDLIECSSESSVRSRTRRERRKRRFERSDQSPSSSRSCRGATRKHRSCSTTRRSPTASATLATSASVSLASSRTGAFRSTTIKASVRCDAWRRKNYLFVHDSDAGTSLAGLYSLVATCEVRSINPFDYLADVLARVQDHPTAAIDELLPGAWTAAHDEM